MGRKKIHTKNTSRREIAESIEAERELNLDRNNQRQSGSQRRKEEISKYGCTKLARAVQ